MVIGKQDFWTSVVRKRGRERRVFPHPAALADLKIATTDPALDLEATTLSGRLLAQAGRPDDALE